MKLHLLFVRNFSNSAMDEEIAQLLSNTLSPDPNVRLGAELRLNQLGNDSRQSILARMELAQQRRAAWNPKQNETLTELRVDRGRRGFSQNRGQRKRCDPSPTDESTSTFLFVHHRAPIDERLMRVSSIYAASFSLKKYVKEHWSPFFATFKDPPATNYEAKAVIRELIFGGLSDPTRKIRLACVRMRELLPQETQLSHCRCRLRSFQRLLILIGLTTGHHSRRNS